MVVRSLSHAFLSGNRVGKVLFAHPTRLWTTGYRGVDSPFQKCRSSGRHFFTPYFVSVKLTMLYKTLPRTPSPIGWARCMCPRVLIRNPRGQSAFAHPTGLLRGIGGRRKPGPLTARYGGHVDCAHALLIRNPRGQVRLPTLRDFGFAEEICW